MNFVDLWGLETSGSVVIKAYEPSEPKRQVDSVSGSLLPSFNYTQHTANQNKEQKALWGKATFVDGLGENSCLLEVGVYSISSELNKTSSFVYANVSLDILNASFNSSVIDGGLGFGAGVNGASVSGKMGVQFNLFGYDINVNIGGAAGLTAGIEGKFDISSGVVLDFGAILRPRLEINWSKKGK